MAEGTGLRPAIELNRGVQMQAHPKGHFICMYVDDPGVYFAEDGSPVSEALAAEAKFDVEGLRRERARQAKLAAAKARIDAEFASELQKLETDPSPVAPTGEPLAPGVEESPGGWTMRKIGKKFEVLDTTGAVVETDLSREEADAMLQAGNAA